MKTAKQIRSIEVLVTARWITMAEACYYSCKSINTIKKLIIDRKIHAAKHGEWTVDRESIDKFFNSRRDEIRIELARRGIKKS